MNVSFLFKLEGIYWYEIKISNMLTKFFEKEQRCVVLGNSIFI